MENNIQLLRKQKKMSMRSLADSANTTASTIQKLEANKIKLTTNWINRIAKALQVDPMQIIADKVKLELQEDVIDYRPDASSFLIKIIEDQNLSCCKLLTNKLDNLGLLKDDIVIIDTSKNSIEELKTGDIALILVKSDHDSIEKRVLRQFVYPCLFIPNHSGQNPPIISTKQSQIILGGVMVSSHRQI